MEGFHIPATLFLLHSLIKAAMHCGRQEEKRNLSDNSKKQQKTGCRSKDPTHMQTHDHNLPLYQVKQSVYSQEASPGMKLPKHITHKPANMPNVVAQLAMPPNMQNIYVRYLDMICLTYMLKPLSCAFVSSHHA